MINKHFELHALVSLQIRITDSAFDQARTVISNSTQVKPGNSADGQDKIVTYGPKITAYSLINVNINLKTKDSAEVPRNLKK